MHLSSNLTQIHPFNPISKSLVLTKESPNHVTHIFYSFLLSGRCPYSLIAIVAVCAGIVKGGFLSLFLLLAKYIDSLSLHGSNRPSGTQGREFKKVPVCNIAFCLCVRGMACVNETFFF